MTPGDLLAVLLRDREMTQGAFAEVLGRPAHGFEHFVLGVIVGVLLSGWLGLIYGLWVTSRPPSKRRVKRDLKRKKAQGLKAVQRAHRLLDDYEKEFGVITEQEMHEIEEELS